MDGKSRVPASEPHRVKANPEDTPSDPESPSAVQVEELRSEKGPYRNNSRRNARHLRQQIKSAESQWQKTAGGRHRRRAGRRLLTARLISAPGYGAAIGGLKVTSEFGWFAASHSGMEIIDKIYAESFRDTAHLQRILKETAEIVTAALNLSK